MTAILKLLFGLGTNEQFTPSFTAIILTAIALGVSFLGIITALITATQYITTL
tara:strand:+ start:2466 stop:2624 length:159 start_codon:yes stop_codon:yes gene_type:complete